MNEVETPIFDPTTIHTWSEEQKAALSVLRTETWPSGQWGRKQRSAFLALLTITGKPSLAYALMDELELWADARRPDEHIWKGWASQWREGRLQVPPKVMDAVQTQYDGHRRADMDASIREANAAHRSISRTVIDGEFDKDTSGALQHLGQFIAIGTEKRQQAYAPKLVRDEPNTMPLLGILMPPPERQALPPGQVIEGEVRQVD